MQSLNLGWLKQDKHLSPSTYPRTHSTRKRVQRFRFEMLNCETNLENHDFRKEEVESWVAGFTYKGLKMVSDKFY
jgi:hypothetical protein